MIYSFKIGVKKFSVIVKKLLTEQNESDIIVNKVEVQLRKVTARRTTRPTKRGERQGCRRITHGKRCSGCRAKSFAAVIMV